MTDLKAMEQRINDLEIQLTYQETTIQDLSDIATKQWETIDALNRKIDLLKDRLSELEEAPQSGAPNDPPPPHF
jgi:SlyX protein